MDTRTWLIHLSPQECERLLDEAPLGRLGVIVDGRPEIFPVNHVLEPGTGGGVAFPTHARTKLHAALDWPWVAYEVDGLDPDGFGWSVLVVGRAEEVTDPEEIAELAGRRRVLWAASEDAHWLRIVPNKVTGRRISAEPVWTGQGGASPASRSQA